MVVSNISGKWKFHSNKVIVAAIGSIVIGIVVIQADWIIVKSQLESLQVIRKFDLNIIIDYINRNVVKNLSESEALLSHVEEILRNDTFSLLGNDSYNCNNISLVNFFLGNSTPITMHDLVMHSPKRFQSQLTPINTRYLSDVATLKEQLDSNNYIHSNCKTKSVHKYYGTCYGLGHPSHG
jgi:hypothetical protein